MIRQDRCDNHVWPSRTTAGVVYVDVDDPDGNVPHRMEPTVVVNARSTERALR